MSIINRMLSDLEDRGEQPTAEVSAPAASPRRTRRPGALRRYAPPAALALALVAVAVALWYQRANVLDSVWRQPAEGPPESGAAPSAAPDNSHNAAGAGKPAVSGLRFRASPQTVELLVETDRALARLPGYSRDGTQVTLRLPVRRSAAFALPAPPSGQDMVRGLAWNPAQPTPELTLTVAQAARIDVTRSGRTLKLAAHQDARPKADAAQASAQGRNGQAQVSANGNEASDRATGSSPDDAQATAQGQAQEAAPVESGGASATDETGTTASVAEAAGREPDPPGTGRQRDTESAPGSGSSEGDGESPASTDTPDAEGPNASRTGSPQSAPEAVEIRKQASSEAELRARRRYRAARRALDAGELTRARAALREALAAQPDLHPARELLVALLRRAGETDTARDVLAEGMKRAPKRVGYAQPYARLLVDAGELERAARVLDRAAPSAQGDADYFALKGVIAQRLERHRAAIEAYTRALEGNARKGRWWLGLAISLAAADHPQQARSAFREARATGDLSDRLESWAQDRIQALAGSGRE